MTYHYTDEQLNKLNRKKAVYSVNRTFAEMNNTTFVTATPKKNPKSDDLEETNIVTAGGQKFQVVATKTDKETGFDGMAVAPLLLF